MVHFHGEAVTYALLLLALAAPAPRPVRPLTEADLLGVYRLSFYGSEYVMALEERGNYCLFCLGTGERLYWGRWSLDAGRVLITVEEWTMTVSDYVGPYRFRWEMRVGRAAKGGGVESRTPGISIRRAGEK